MPKGFERINLIGFDGYIFQLVRQTHINWNRLWFNLRKINETVKELSECNNRKDRYLKVLTL